MTLQEAAAQADALAQAGSERELADLRAAVGTTSSRRPPAARTSASAPSRTAPSGSSTGARRRSCCGAGLDDESPACRGSALLSVELLSRDHPSTVNGVRPLLHSLVSADGNEAVRRLAVLALKNGSPQRDTIVLLEGLAGDDEADAQLRKTAASVAQQLKRRVPRR